MRVTVLKLMAMCVLGASGCVQPQVRSFSRPEFLSVQAVPPQAQVRADRLSPVFVTLHDTGTWQGPIDVECTLGTVTVVESVPAESLRFSRPVFLTLPVGVTPAAVPAGPTQVRCRASARGDGGPSAGEAATAAAELVIKPPALPDFTLARSNAYELLPGSAFDCKSHAPPIATRHTCVEIESRDLGATVAAGVPTIQCLLDGVPLREAREPADSTISLGQLAAGPHSLRCTTTAPAPEWEADRSNNTLELNFEVGDGSAWHVDLAITEVVALAEAARVVVPSVGSDSAPRSVAGVQLAVRVRNVAGVRVFAVEVICVTGESVFEGIWARSGSSSRETLRGLDPGETALVEVTRAGPFASGTHDVKCDARAKYPEEVPELQPRDNQWRGRVSFP